MGPIYGALARIDSDRAKPSITGWKPPVGGWRRPQLYSKRCSSAFSQCVMVRSWNRGSRNRGPKLLRRPESLYK